MELPPIATGVEVVHEGRLRAVLNDVGWYAKKHNVTPDQVHQFFVAGLLANHILQRNDFTLDTNTPSIATQTTTCSGYLSEVDTNLEPK